MEKVSIVVPTLNEEKNITLLVERIDQACFLHDITYEIIFVDDHSKDKTQDAITRLSRLYPVKLHKKIGKGGKAQSLLEGFKKTQYEILCMIDADLQYPPEAIPQMIKKLSNGDGDIIIAQRKYGKKNILRRITSQTFTMFFGKLLHGMSYDIQSGLKVFKKEIVERVKLTPSPWTFDLEFLKKAQYAGYKVTTVPILFQKRQTGKSKLNVYKATIEIGLNALRLKFKGKPLIKFHPRTEKEKGKGFHFKGKEFVQYTDLKASESALFRLSTKQKIFVTILALSLFIAAGVNWYTTIVFLIALLTMLYFLDLLFNLFLIYRSFVTSPEIKVREFELSHAEETLWPNYTIFCPLYKEWNVVPQFVRAIERLDYPKDKLQVMMLLEEDDTQTTEKIQRMQLPNYFEVVVVPDSQPKTKPKACNYGLTLARGEYVVIYDAEDIPEPDQLKKAVLAFRKSSKKIACIQAKLNFYNPSQNLLTRVFTAEYSLWFDLVLTGLQSISAPIPLGGTSNHFRAITLRKLQGWDAFNVTEDADLGMRLVKKGYKTALLNSTTYEEANSDLVNWFFQRTRWIKGYIQTYLVHMRHPMQFTKSSKKPHLFTFQIIIGGKILSMFINPLMWVITIAYFALRPTLGPVIESLFPPIVFYLAVFSLVVGNFLYAYYYLVGCMKREQDYLMKYMFLVPIYWLMMSVAAWTALIKFIYQPHYWSKTKHGLHLSENDAEKISIPTAQVRYSV